MEYEDKLNQAFEISTKMNYRDYCRSLQACLISSYGEYPEYCDNCCFKECCIMHESPDTMLEDVLGGWYGLALREQPSEKAKKYDLIVDIINQKLK